MKVIKSNHKIVKQARTHKDTPLYIFDLKNIIKQIKRYTSNKSKNFKTLFSVKSCFEKVVLKKALNLVDGYDIANHNEFKYLYGLNLKNKILSMCGPSYDSKDVRKLVRNNIKKIILVFDNKEQFDDCKKFVNYPNVYFMFRITENYLSNKSNGHYGFELEEIKDHIQHKKCIGTHIHIPRASNMRSVKNYLKFYKMSLKLGVNTINFGGGQHHYDWFKLKKYLRDKDITYIIEPGQPFFVDCIYGVGKILTVKKRKQSHKVITNIGDLCHLQWSRDKKIITKKSNKKEKIQIFGPACSTDDQLGTVYSDIGNFEVGENIVFSNINPLSIPLSREFNGIKKSKIVWA